MERQNSEKRTGTLYLCATPIGNLEDISLRVLRTLREADLIAAEDTRTSGHLLQHFDIHTPVTSYHKFNEEEKGEELIGKLLSGRSIALITDAGTPAISDPGEVLVRKCQENGIPVTSLPGANACITALTLSGLSARRFVFEGFLPNENREKAEVLASLKTEQRTMVLYEAPHRLKRTLGALKEELGGDRTLTLCRELTKKYETVEKTTIDEALQALEVKEARGEYVLVIEGKSREAAEAEAAGAWQKIPVADHVAGYEAQGYTRKEAMKLAAKDRGVTRREIYQRLLDERS